VVYPALVYPVVLYPAVLSLSFSFSGLPAVLRTFLPFFPNAMK
jgi:hypothetical protein